MREDTKDIEKISEFTLNQLTKEYDLLRKRMHEIEQKVAIHSYMHETCSKNMMDALKNLKEVKQLIDQINMDTYRRTSTVGLVREILENPRSWVLLLFFIATLEITIGATDALKHFL